MCEHGFADAITADDRAAQDRAFTETQKARHAAAGPETIEGVLHATGNTPIESRFEGDEARSLSFTLISQEKPVRVSLHFRPWQDENEKAIADNQDFIGGKPLRIRVKSQHRSFNGRPYFRGVDANIINPAS